MIELKRPPAPAKLSTAYVTAGVAKFAADGSSVWNVPEIKETLSTMSQGKCCYCEATLGTGAAYLEVEHFFAKKHHPGRVLDWDNLLPACKRCNGHKGEWDVAVAGQMMVDPVLDAPRLHIQLDENYRPVGRTPQGRNTIIEVDLNDIDRLGVMRYKIGEKFKLKLEELYDEYAALSTASTLAERRKVVRRVKKALELCHSDQPFSAVVATVLDRSPVYQSLKASMVAAGDWDPQLQSSDGVARNASLA